MYYLKLLCQVEEHFSIILYPKTYMLDSRASACAAPLWPNSILFRYNSSREECRAGGKPSTWFPPGTRRADHLTMKFLFQFPFFWRIFRSLFPAPAKILNIFNLNSKISSFFIIFCKQTQRLLTKV